MTVTVVGGGRLGRPLARALRAAGAVVHGPMMRGETVPSADVVLLCVTDGEIAGAADMLHGSAALIGSVSGANPLAELDVDFGWHPLQTFVGDEGPDAFRGIGCAIAGKSVDALAVAQQLADLLGAHAFPVADDQRAAYHAAASIASNFTVTLLAAAENVAAGAGLTPAEARALLAPLVRRTIENWAVRGPEAALTGPVSRGDERTVTRQRDAIAGRSPEVLPLFDVLCESTRGLAKKGRATA
ncbi:MULTISPECIES: DUF2520 domain-containing protein [Microbacterium]|uniref:DUF2520 domain-containing protein n=1 Tax=Microbacterium TaxID=33882 RepID=UPI0003DE123A|nr:MULTISPECIES: DUF2520 domain-containing protein [Microbacterium]CDK01650.1 conserved hypothetical protein [Microbacterium sp. C448]